MKLLQMPGKRPVVSVGAGADGGVLPQVWATDGNLAHDLAHAVAPAPVLSPVLVEVAASASTEVEALRAAPVFRKVLDSGTAFYRSYTEAMLRRYGVLSMESGRVPSMLGREMFRGKVTSYRVHGFDDVVIFVLDVERCIKALTPEQQRLIQRIAVQEYTFAEAARMFGLTMRSVQRRYFEAVDELTGIFLRKKLLERVVGNSCQGGEEAVELVSHSPDGGCA